MVECYYIELTNNTVADFKKGISWLLAEARAAGSGWMAVHGLRNLDHIIDYEGMQVLERLRKPPHENTINNVLLKLITELKVPYSVGNLPLLAVHPSKKYLEKLYSIADISKMMVVPWGMGDLEQWIQYSGAIQYGSAQAQASSAPSAVNKVVMAALSDLTSLVNRTTGIGHPLDKDKAIELFEILKANGEKFTPVDVKITLISQFKWNAEHAQDVVDVAEKILAGRRVKKTGGGRMFRADIIDAWRKQAVD